MARGPVGPLARLLEGGPVAGLTDGQLLDRFAGRGGAGAEAAFEALVTRHGPMVARVCRQSLRDPHDVEDAFQATFLVLVRRADSIGERDLLGPWLHGVAHRVARKARAVAGKRRGREGGQAGFDPPARLDPAARVDVDLAPVLHEEVNRLPAKYRRPIILCHLQGLTHAEAADELAWPVGTVSVRLVRARKILADRLTRRGITTATVAAVTTTLTAEASAALVPASWIHTVAVAALATSSGLPLTTTVSVGALTLARRTSMTMFLSPWKWLAIPATAALTTAAGVGLIHSSPGPADDPQQPPTPADAKVAPDNKQQPKIGFFDPPALVNRTVAGVRIMEGDNVKISGKVAGLVDVVEALRQSDPTANYQLLLTGGKIRYQIPVIPPAQGDRPPVATPEKQGQSKQAPEKPPVAIPPAIIGPGGRGELGDVPPDYFTIPAPQPGTPGSPRPVQIGQKILVEVLEALPGRPITGERIVRTDGTIGLGFYGDLYVAGLNRDQIKAKLLEKLRVILPDDMLGLVVLSGENILQFRAVPLERNGRVYIDDQPILEARNNRGDEGQANAAPAAPLPASGPKPVQPGQLLVIEVLEALPGRPITGERTVRADGTISLGFYGDLAVNGLTRDQIKVKVIELLRPSLSAEVLGLKRVDPATGQTQDVPPVQSDRIFVDDYVEYDPADATLPATDGRVRVGQLLVIEVLEALPGRPIVGERIVRPDGTLSLGFYGELAVAGLTRDQIKLKVIDHLRAKLTDEQLGLVRVDQAGAKHQVGPVDSDRVFVDDAVPRLAPRTVGGVDKMQERIADLSGKLDAALAAIEQLRRDQVQPEPPQPGAPQPGPVDPKAIRENEPPRPADPKNPPVGLMPLPAGQGEVPSPSDPKPAATLDQIVREWEERSAGVKTLQVAFDRIDKSAKWGDKASRGMLLLKSPNLACLEFKRAVLGPDGKPKTKLDRDGHSVIEAEREPYQRIVLTGQELVQYEWDEKVVYLYPFKPGSPPSFLSPDAILMPLKVPFLFGLTAVNARQRFDLQLLKSEDRHHVIALNPRDPLDQKSFRRAVIWLDRETLTPSRLVLFPVGDKDSQEFRFTSVERNVAADDALFKPITNLAGWKAQRSSLADMELIQLFVDGMDRFWRFLGAGLAGARPAP